VTPRELLKLLSAEMAAAGRARAADSERESRSMRYLKKRPPF
jgi:hypothetical protein